MAAVLWSLPLLASALIALLRYGFGSLFVFGESVAVALLRGTGADIAGTVQRLDAGALPRAAEAAIGVLISGAAASVILRRPGLGAALAALAAVEAWWVGVPVAASLLAAAMVCGTITIRG